MSVVRDSEEFEGRTAYVVRWQRPDRFGVFFDVTSSGRLPITIEGLGGDRDTGDSVAPRTRLHSGVEPEAARFPGFSPVTLSSGETAFLGLEVLAGSPCDGLCAGVVDRLGQHLATPASSRAT